MKLISLIILVLLCLYITNAKAQYFNNSNNELSYQLYEKNDTLGKYRVFIVFEDLLLKDFELIQKWDSLTTKKKIQITENWAIEGRRIEVERFPYISYYPIFEVKIANPKLFPNYQK